MAPQIKLAASWHERFMHAAQEEMAEFERKERELRKRAKEERAVEMNLPKALLNK